MKTQYAIFLKLYPRRLALVPKFFRNLLGTLPCRRLALPANHATNSSRLQTLDRCDLLGVTSRIVLIFEVRHTTRFGLSGALA